MPPGLWEFNEAAVAPALTAAYFRVRFPPEDLPEACAATREVQIGRSPGRRRRVGATRPETSLSLSFGWPPTRSAPLRAVSAEEGGRAARSRCRRTKSRLWAAGVVHACGGNLRSARRFRRVCTQNGKSSFGPNRV